VCGIGHCFVSGKLNVSVSVSLSLAISVSKHVYIYTSIDVGAINSLCVCVCVCENCKTVFDPISNVKLTRRSATLRRATIPSHIQLASLPASSAPSSVSVSISICVHVHVQKVSDYLTVTSQ